MANLRHALTLTPLPLFAFCSLNSLHRMQATTRQPCCTPCGKGATRSTGHSKKHTTRVGALDRTRYSETPIIPSKVSCHTAQMCKQYTYIMPHQGLALGPQPVNRQPPKPCILQALLLPCSHAHVRVRPPHLLQRLPLPPASYHLTTRSTLPCPRHLHGLVAQRHAAGQRAPGWLAVRVGRALLRAGAHLPPAQRLPQRQVLPGGGGPHGIRGA